MDEQNLHDGRNGKQKKREQMVTDYTAGSTSVMQVKLEENQQFSFWMLIVFRWRLKSRRLHTPIERHR